MKYCSNKLFICILALFCIITKPVIAQKGMQNLPPRHPSYDKFEVIGVRAKLSIGQNPSLGKLFSKGTCNLEFNYDSFSVVCFKEKVSESFYLKRAGEAFGQDSSKYKSFIAKWQYNWFDCHNKFEDQLNKGFQRKEGTKQFVGNYTGDLSKLFELVNAKYPYTLRIYPSNLNLMACGKEESGWYVVSADFYIVGFSNENNEKVFEAKIINALGQYGYMGGRIAEVVQQENDRAAGNFYQRPSTFDHIQEAYAFGGKRLGYLLSEYFYTGIIPTKLK